MTQPEAGARTGVFALLANNPAYRRLWLAQLISFCGDWFTLVALVQLVKSETGGRLAIGALLATQLAPNLFLGSIAGSVADRIPRRIVMITCDALRAAGALAFLLPAALGLHGGGFVAWILGWVAFQHSVTVFFRPASSASMPSLVRLEDLSSAGTLDGLSWSLGLVVGSALGGLAVDQFGVSECFIIDSLSFVVSLFLVRSLPLPRAAAAPESHKKGPAFADFGELFAEMRRNPALVPLVLTKCAWGVSAAQLLLLTEFGDRLLGTAAASAGFGMLYAARGLGTAFGPAIARRVLGESDRAIRASITWGFAAAALFYWCFGGQPAPVIALLCISAAHAGGSMVWIGATVLVQRTAPDRVRGRAFALEMALHTLTACVCPLLAAWLVDRGHDPAELVRAFALAIAGMGLLWSLAARHWR
jgi:MFS family permease